MLPPADPARGCAQQMAEFHRLVDEDGRLLTSREAKKMGLSRFTKKKKGKNSLARRCTCGRTSALNQGFFFNQMLLRGLGCGSGR